MAMTPPMLTFVTFSRRWFLTGLCLFASNCMAATSQTVFDEHIKHLLSSHFDTYKQKEYFSGISLSIYLPGKMPLSENRNYYIGRVSHEPGSDKISGDTLFQIGSITKSFTAALALQLEKSDKLGLKDTIGKWLPDYPKWSPVSIESMLNMTSGLPNYSDTPLWNAEVYKNLSREWSDSELLDFVYPKGPFNPPLKDGYFYTNTGYILTSMIIEKAAGASLKQLYENHLFKAAGLTHTYYPIPRIDPVLQRKLAHGYNYNQYDNPALVGKDVTNNSMTWARAAGGIIATSEDVIKWVNALFASDAILNKAQKEKLMSLVSTQTGKPIPNTTKDDSRGFGLGVVQGYDPDIMNGHYWFYEGQTLGYRAFYVYKPCNGIILSAIYNSSTNGENDQGAKVLVQIYKQIITDYPEYQCKD